MELYWTLSPFLFMKKFDGQMLPFMNPCKVRWNSDLQAIVRRRKRNKTIPFKMKGIVMDARIGNLTVESSLHHFMIVFTCKKYSGCIQISVSDAIVNLSSNRPVFRFFGELIYDKIGDMMHLTLLVPIDAFI